MGRERNSGRTRLHARERSTDQMIQPGQSCSLCHGFLLISHPGPCVSLHYIYPESSVFKRHSTLTILLAFPSLSPLKVTLFPHNHCQLELTIQSFLVIFPLS